MSVNIHKISHVLFLSTSMNSKLLARAISARRLDVKVKTFVFYICRLMASFIARPFIFVLQPRVHPLQHPQRTTLARP